MKGGLKTILCMAERGYSTWGAQSLQQTMLTLLMKNMYIHDIVLCFAWGQVTFPLWEMYLFSILNRFRNHPAPFSPTIPIPSQFLCNSDPVFPIQLSLSPVSFFPTVWILLHFSSSAWPYVQRCQLSFSAPLNWKCDGGILWRSIGKTFIWQILWVPSRYSSTTVLYWHPIR